MQLTVGQKLHQVLVQYEGATAQLKSFALDTQDKQAKAMYAQLAQKMEQEVIPPLRERINFIESEEPQYRVFEQAMQQADEQHQPTQS